MKNASFFIICFAIFSFMGVSQAQSPQTSYSFTSEVTLTDADTAYFTFPFPIPDSRAFNPAYSVDQSWIVNTVSPSDTAVMAAYLETSNDNSTWAGTGDTVAIIGSRGTLLDVKDINAKYTRLRLSQTTDPDTTTATAAVRTLINSN